MSQEVDQLLKQLRFPPEGNGERRVATATATPTRTRAGQGRPMVGAAKESRFGAWPWVLLALVLGSALPFWPYPRACGWLLAGYLAAAVVLTLVSSRAMFGSWDARQGWAHSLSVAAFIWSLTLLALELLPRIGYAAATASWGCPAL